MNLKRPSVRQTHLFAPNVEDEDIPDSMSFDEIEKHLVRKHYYLELEGNPAAARVIDQIMKAKEMRVRSRQYELQEEANKVKPSIAVIPVFADYEQWKEIAAKQQEDLITDTVKL